MGSVKLLYTRSTCFAVQGVGFLPSPFKVMSPINYHDLEYGNLKLWPNSVSILKFANGSNYSSVMGSL